MDIDFEKYEKQLGLGAYGAAGALVVAWMGFLWLTMPVSSGGMDRVSHLCVGAASAAVFGWLVLAHAWFGRQLTRGADSIRG